MKKIAVLLLCAVLSVALLAGCGQSATTETTDTTDATETTETIKIKVGASPAPHAEILEAAKEELAKKGVEMEIVQFTDYVMPNTSLEDGSLDANYFQHKPYLDNFNEENDTHLVSVAAIHYEPLGLYPGKTASIDELADGATIAVPNDTTNEARALLLLESAGIITLDPDAGLTATKLDIVDNPKNIEILEIEAAQLPRSLQDVDMAVINGNYAIDAGMQVSDALAKEEKDSEAAQTYANIVAVKEGHENDPGIVALVEALQSETVRTFIEETYEGAVVPIF